MHQTFSQRLVSITSETRIDVIICTLCRYFFKYNIKHVCYTSLHKKLIWMFVHI